MNKLLKLSRVNLSYNTDNNLINVLQDVSFEVDYTETISIVGESGSGKSTLGKALIKLIKPTSGSILYKGQEITELEKDDLREIRKNFQIIFQDPYSSLNPRKTVSQIISEPFIIHDKNLSEKTILEKTEYLLYLVGLTTNDMKRYPHQFSGGQRQRIGIARALALEPEFIVCDEPVSALDVSIQAQIINLLKELQKKLNLTYLFISHDLSVVKKVSTRIAVMYLGKIVEISTRNAIYGDAKHPYTQALLSAIPTPNPQLEKKRQEKKIILEGDLPSPFKPPKGCNFSTRCFLKDEVKKNLNINCNLTDIELQYTNKNHQVSCHLYSK